MNETLEPKLVVRLAAIGAIAGYVAFGLTGYFMGVSFLGFLFGLAGLPFIFFLSGLFVVFVRFIKMNLSVSKGTWLVLYVACGGLGASLFQIVLFGSNPFNAENWNFLLTLSYAPTGAAATLGIWAYEAALEHSSGTESS